MCDRTSRRLLPIPPRLRRERKRCKRAFGGGGRHQNCSCCPSAGMMFVKERQISRLVYTHSRRFAERFIRGAGLCILIVVDLRNDAFVNTAQVPGLRRRIVQHLRSRGRECGAWRLLQLQPDPEAAARTEGTDPACACGLCCPYNITGRGSCEGSRSWCLQPAHAASARWWRAGFICASGAGPAAEHRANATRSPSVCTTAPIRRNTARIASPSTPAAGTSPGRCRSARNTSTQRAPRTICAPCADPTTGGGGQYCHSRWWCVRAAKAEPSVWGGAGRRAVSASSVVPSASTDAQHPACPGPERGSG